MRTSGMAVTFSGVTVIVALAGLFLIDAKVVQSMAVGAIVVVGIAVIAAVTLLPALIAALGHRVARPGKIIGRIKPKPKPKEGPGFWERWTAMLMRRPLPFALAATALMLLIASPALVLKENTAAIAMFPKDFETRVGFELAAQQLGGEGALGPIQLVFDGTNVDGFVAVGHRAVARREGGVARRPVARREEDARRRHPRRIAGERGDPRARRSIA